MKKLPLATALAIAFGAMPIAGPLLFAAPATATLTLVEQAGVNEIELGVDVPLLPDDMDTTNLSGSVDVLLEIDPDTGQVSEFSALGGDLTGTGVSLSGSTFLLGSYEFTSSDLGADLRTPLCPGVVDPATGEFDASQHAFTINGGNLDGSVRIPLLGVDETTSFDFTANPTAGNGTGTGVVTLVETASTPDSKTYDLTVTFSLEIEQNVETPVLEVPVSASGEIRAVGTTTVSLVPKDPYVAWAEVHGMPGALFEGDENSDGIPNGLQWALGLCADTPPWPFLLQPIGKQDATVVFMLNLHPAGTDGELTVLVSNDPSTEEFVPLASEAVSTGNPIPAGTTGEVTISLPDEGRGFVRLAAEAP